MSFENLLDHKCDIYHLNESEKAVGYGLPDSQSFGYPDKPDEESVPCHFGVESLDAETEQKRYKLNI